MNFVRGIHFLLFICLMFFAFNERSFAGGVTVGNGGAFFQCYGESKLTFVDRLIKFEEIGKPLPVSGWRANLIAIANALGRFQDKRLQNLSKDLFNFEKYVFVEFSAESKWIWNDSGSPLPVMYNPGIDGKIPSSCSRTYQAVYRFDESDYDSYIRFKYSGDVVKRVLTQEEGPLEISFLLLHEWLWSSFQRNHDPIRLAHVNQLMHSQQFQKMTESEVLSLFY